MADFKAIMWETMTSMNKLIDQHREIVSLISNRRVKTSLDTLRSMIDRSGQGRFYDEFDSLSLTYKNMLRYTIEIGRAHV